MGMPSINIIFKEKAEAVLRQSDRGIVGLIIKGTVPAKNPVTVTAAEDIPSAFSADNRAEIERVLLGNEAPPQKVIVYCLAAAAAEISPALDYFENTKIGYLSMPPACEEDLEVIESWVNKVRKNGRIVKAVLPEFDADNEAIINFATNKVVTEKGEFTAAQYCGRIAGICAGTPLTQAVTYAKLSEVTDCQRLTRPEMDEAVDAGKLILFNDGEKVKIARGVNSLQTTAEGKGDQFKKIKILDVMDTVKSDITTCIQDQYIGKYTNSYDHKCLLISSIGKYLEELVTGQILDGAFVEIDIPAVKQYLEQTGTSTEDMTLDEIRQAYTGEKIFLVIRMRIMDAIEDVFISIEV